MTSLKRILFLLSLFAGTACVHPSQYTSSTEKRLPAQTSGALGEVTSEEINSFPKIGGFTPIKFVIELKNGLPDGITFIDPRIHAFHYQYLATTAQFPNATAESIRNASFRKDGRQILLGLVLVGNHIGEGNWDFRTPFQLTTEELPSIAILHSTSELIKSWAERNTPKYTNFYSTPAYQPLPNHRQEVKDRISEYASAGIEVKLNQNREDIQAYTSGWAAGKLKVFVDQNQLNQAIAAGQLDSSSIILVNSDVLELPPVAGVISNFRITEASHMVLLAQMYGIPLVFQKDALAKLGALDGKNVYIKTASEVQDSYEMTAPISDEKVKKLQSLRPERSLKDLKVDWQNQSIVAVDNIQEAQISSYGGKATKFGLIRRNLPKDHTRSLAVGIPLHYFKRFLAESKLPSGENLEAAVRTKLSTISLTSPYPQVVEVSDQIRKLMKSAVPPAGLIEDIQAKLVALFPSKEEVRLKLRSSSNVEDGDEFNGAGLYDSKGACVSNCKKNDFQKDLISVWTSLYTARGLWARTRFQVSEELVGMGILAHTPYKGELFNGVAKLKFAVGAKGQREAVCEILGVAGEEDSITNSEQGGGNERVLLRNGSIWALRPLQGAPEGRAMMATPHYTKICELMAQLHGAWPKPLNDREIESEWKLIKLDGKENVQIKQVRIVPQPKLFKIADGQKIVLLPEFWSLNGDWMADVTSFQFRTEQIAFRTSEFTYEDFIKGKVSMGNALVTIRNKKYEMKASAPKLEIDKVTWGEEKGQVSGHRLVFELTHKDLPKIDMRMNLSVQKGAKLISSADFVIDSDFGPFFSSYNEFPTFVYDKKSRSLGTEAESLACPVIVRGESLERWVGSDAEIRTFTELQVTGVLPKRTIKIKNPLWPLFHEGLHEGNMHFYIDLFLDSSLTDSEKQKLQSMGGRYLGNQNGWSLSKKYRDIEKAKRLCKPIGDD